MTSAEAADEPDDEEDDKDQANEADSPTVVVPPRASIAIPHAPEQEEEHDDHDDDPEHSGASTIWPMSHLYCRIGAESGREATRRVRRPRFPSPVARWRTRRCG